jgi:hypothetical protein
MLCFVTAPVGSHTAHVYDINGRYVATAQTEKVVEKAKIRVVGPVRGDARGGWEDAIPPGIYVLLWANAVENEGSLPSGREFGFEDVTDSYLPGDEWATTEGELGDLNGDGLEDFVFSRSWYASDDTCTVLQPRVWIQQDGGVFLDETQDRPPDLIMPGWDIELFDAEGDDDLDIFVTGFDASEYPPAALLINDGTGVFADESAARLPGFNPSAYAFVAEAARIDGNSSMDLVVMTYTFGYWDNRPFQPELWLNDGQGFFVRDRK